MEEIARSGFKRHPLLANSNEVMGSKPTDSPKDHHLSSTDLVNLIDQRHELVRLADLIVWQALADEWSPQFVSSAGRPALPTGFRPRCST